jgi:2-keto-3-deoxy-6-phosphogluconate aldolase
LIRWSILRRPSGRDDSGTRGVSIIAAVMTSIGRAAAFRHGIPALKPFPARLLGSGFLRRLQGAVGRFPVVSTGSIEAGDVGLWVEAGTTGVGPGSALTGGDHIIPALEEVSAR